MSNRPRVCPRCGKNYTDYPSVSRLDNETDICPQCGLMEAMIPIKDRKTESIFLRADKILKGVNEREKQSLKDFQRSKRNLWVKIRKSQRSRS